MVLGLPRSATSWASNWLTTDKTLCLHDPLFEHHYSNLDSIASLKRLGVACSGLFLFPQWVNAHPARKVIVHRALDEVTDSLDRIGLPACQTWSLDRLEGHHCEWTDLFEKPAPIYEFLLKLPFDEERHAVLKGLNVQPHFSTLRVNRDVTQALRAQLA